MRHLSCEGINPRPIPVGGSANHIIPVYFSREYTASANDFDTLRKPGWVADLLHEQPVAGIALVAPALLDSAVLATVHDAAYVRAVQTGDPRHLAESSGFHWDAGLWTSVCASNGGVVAAARAALGSRAFAGSLSCGLHHARVDVGRGFCTFNGLALAARACIDAGAHRVLVLDLDAHCGGGTASLVSAWPEVTQVDVSVSSFDRYDPVAGHTLHVVSQADEYLPTVERVLIAAVDSWDVVLYNAGMDPHEHSGIGGLRGVTTEMLAARERLVFTWARHRGIPVAFVLAGGYASARLPHQALAALHRRTVVAAAEAAETAGG
jgi:acetoin utilization deacetylase AcuC-like enzyme